MPTNSGPCSNDGLACSYGDDPRSGCRWRYRCESGHWQTFDQPDVGVCDTLAAGCPTSPPSGTCAVLGDSCVYPSDGVFCGCATGEPTPEWKCGDVPSAPCPTLLPNEGDLCSSSSTCDYGCNVDGQGVQASCDEGVWVWNPCP